MLKMSKKGISLIALIITIIVVVILAGAVILSIANGGFLDSSKKARFMSDFRSVEEGVSLYSMNDILNTQNTINPKLPVEVNKLTFTEKDDIVFNVPTLKEKIEELNPGQTIYDRDLYWIKESDIGVTLSKEKQEKGYIIDGQTMQIYDYNGDVFSKLRWHTLDAGVDEASVVREPSVEEMWNGWIRLTLYYPASSTEKQWRIGTEGELRADPMLMWQNYTGSITIPLDRMKDVWIKYNLNGKDVIIPPAGKLLVDIEPDKTGTTKVDKVNVTINYDSEATIKEYRIGDSGWLTYNGPFTVTENCIIEARAKKPENVYNTDGSILLTRNIVGSDMVHIGNIGIEEKVQTNSQLPAPIIERLSPQNGTEKARVKITYPAQASSKKYMQNYGSEQDYANEISINEFGTVIVAYYYDASGNKSQSTLVYINDTTAGQQPEIPELVKELSAPIIERLAAQSPDEKARIKITYPSDANSKIYTKDHGVEEVYSDEISIKEWGTQVTAYYYDVGGKKSKISEIYINDTSKGQEPQKPKIEDPKIPQITPAPSIVRLDALTGSEKARVQIVYPEQAVRKVYKVNYGVEQEYGDIVSIENWGTNIIAYYYDKYGNMSEITSITINDTSTGEQPQTPENYDPVPPKIPDTITPPTTMNTDENLAAPTITRLVPQDASEKARVSIEYPAQAVRKMYTINDGTGTEYTGEIKIYGWGTKIIAYYYDVNGNKSKQSQILINEVPTLAEETKVFKPDSLTSAPDINISPSTGIVNQVTLTVTPPVTADKIYLKLGKYAEFKEYTVPVVVKENMEVYAYYKATTGETSITANKIIGNIKEDNRPYLKINANPYPLRGSKGANNVNITLSYSDADKVEYSEDGIIYSIYTAQFQITENKRIYARATNSYGVTECQLDITNIGEGQTGAQTDTNTDGKEDTEEIGVPTVPEPIKKLGVSINAEPDPTITQTKVAQVKISIEYDKNATDKLYSIGKYGQVKRYTGSFDVTSNCTIYAYAKAENSLGEAIKVIDNVLNGISDPVIITEPIASVTASKVAVSIKYDKYATVKKYSINGGTLQDYTEGFDVSENGTKIYAYSENSVGQKSSSYYTIQNIVPLPPVLILDKGSYYILKLNYPEGSKVREYKWKETGEWGSYKEDGILLIKPQFKDQVIKDGTLIKIEDENGDKIDFKGDYYFIDVPFSELFENIFMRWDRTAPKAPQIVINPTELTKQVTATIIYDEALIKKQYRVLYPGDVLGQWIDYTGSIAIDKNNTIIYSRGMDEAEVWSQEGMYKVTNIDETPPLIDIVADLTNSKKEVPVTVNVTDDSEVLKIKWVAGAQAESYFKTAGTEIANNSIVNITDNGYYTFYAEDIFGNVQVYTLNLNNIDRVSPDNPTISATPTGWTNENVIVTILYSTDTATKEYSLDGINWNTYATSLNIGENNVTVYARAIDEAGNQSGQSTLTIANIDRDAPIVTYGTNGGSSETASTTVIVSDANGLNASTLQYVWDTQNTATPISGWTTFASGNTITKGNVNGIYYLWIKASDNAGNSVVSKSNLFTIIQPVVVNKPVLSAGMTAKRWNGSSWDTVASPDTDTTWYDYSNKQWANAQTADGSMWVWIPRYEYKITTPHSSTAQTIAVNFLNNTSTTSTSEYTIHPAFTFGSTELTGIWVAKFEASGTISAVDIKPGQSRRNITIDAMFTACRNMEINSRYGWGTTGTGIDTHLMKNIEWGSVAYLSQSIYGKNSEVWKNPSTMYITGQAGTSVSARYTTSTYPYNNMTYGVNASTTGNIYGVYDMSGGSEEYTAAYVNNGSASLTLYGASLVSASSQYKDVYTAGDTSGENYLANANKKGDAIYETSTEGVGSTSWYGDASNMPYATLSFFMRGGSCYDDTIAGAFDFYYSNGNANTNNGFRPVLVVSGTL